jgi:hypothetical protein
MLNQTYLLKILELTEYRFAFIAIENLN